MIGAEPAPGGAGAGLRRPPRREGGGAGGEGANESETLISPIQGTILKVAVKEGAEVAENELICIVEAMKMENEITAHRAGTVTTLNVSEGGTIATGETIAIIE